MSETVQMVGDRLNDMLVSYAPNVVGAAILLLVGWLLALGLAALTGAALRRTQLDNRIAKGLAGEGSHPVETEAIARRVVFWLAMVLVLVGVLQILGLTLATGPLNELLNTVFEFVPRLLAAAILLLVAWVVATLLRFLITRGLSAAGVDQKVSGQDRTKEIPLSRTIGQGIYWLIFLLFLPAVLDALALRGLLEPVQGMLNQVLAFLPQLVAAAIILVVGWFLARIVQGIVRNLSVAAGADRLAEKIGISGALGQQKLSGLLGIFVYILVLVPVLIAALNALALDAITLPASNMLNMVLAAIPSIFAAVLLMFLAYLVGRVVARLIGTLLAGAGFDRLLARVGLSPAVGKAGRSPSDIAAQVLLAAVLLFAGIEALRLINFDTLADLVAEFLVFAGNIFLGLVIFGVGLFLSGLAARTIRAGGTRQADFLATVARISILFLAAAMGLRRMGIADEIVNIGFAILVGAVAVAAAIAFGIGGRDIAQDKLKSWWAK